VLRDQLGLFDAQPDRQEIRLSLAIAGMMFAALLLILPLRSVPWGEIVAFIPTIDAVMFVGELITATLLYAQAAVFRSRALSVLATGYVFAALLLVPHMLTFPGAFATDGLLGAGTNTTAWISFVRRLAFPLAIILYVQLRRSDLATRPGTDQPTAGIGVGIAAAVALSVVITILTTSGHELLPPFFANRSDLIVSYATGYQTVAFALFLVAAVMLFRARKSILDVWLLVALWGWLIESLLILTLPGRFTAGWYGLYGLTLFSHLIVMLALIAETNRLYARLALTTAARDRERDVRLMSMGAVAAAISHEVGQPLAAVTTNALASLSWLTRPKPDVAMAIKAQQATIEAGQRTFDVIKSVRAMFTKEPATPTEHSLNDLVRETASLLDKELASAKVSLNLEMHEALLPIRANRAQIQRVLVNLFLNAIESLAATRGRARMLVVRSMPVSSTDVLLEMIDNGVGIEPEEIDNIFEAFVTTKMAGTGLGLALCRTIVEEHGGLLWASQGDGNGATFHLRLPCGDR
jgi:signal transduction histidine kinase